MSTPKNAAYGYGEEDAELRRGPWTVEEDTLLIHYIACHGEGRWNLLAKSSGLKRTGKSCRLRWLNYLKPDVKRGNLTPEEQLLILELHSKWGNRWSKIAQHLPGRTDNEIKNYWRTRVQKQARHLKIDANSMMFRDAIRCFWMPRLLQKMEESSSAMKTQNSSTPPSTPLNQTSQASALPPPPPPPPPLEGSLRISKAINSFDHEKNSNPGNYCTSPSIFSSDSMMSISKFPEISDYPATSLHNFDNSDYNPFLRSSFYVDNCGSYDMDDFNMSAMSVMGGYETSDCHMAESNWAYDDMAESIWNIDELWQFRKLQDRNI
ncbi:PREDICTED: transcription factor MYB108-like [Nelumbo nucifera]|uniref:Transcription factor MYB108-like n=2 Tax=Nelumbo nucifera TaxID=4432 RepID=A0A1U8AN92_NELNU|nr:PREDICTED: transcription factor MYB108-like [Nelumbo nucifera]DAD35380.1 TPA_asm: hypothetical protein HUJ06_006020 [Nelumbo nucifera]